MRTFFYSFFLLTCIFLFPSVAQAKSGCCSGHDGVSCSTGPQSNGKVVCNDGWRGSSCLYSEMVMCGGSSGSEPSLPVTPSTPIPTLKPIPVATPRPTPKPTPRATPTPEPAKVPTPVPTPSATPTPEPSPTSIVSPTPTAQAEDVTVEETVSAENVTQESAELEKSQKKSGNRFWQRFLLILWML